MSHTARALLLSLSSLLLMPTAALAQELDPEKVAKIRLAEQEAMDKIAKEHGNRLPGEMDNAERRRVIEKQQAAAQEVLAKHGVSTKEWAVYTARMSREEQAQSESAQKRLVAEAKAREKEKAERAAAAKKESAGEIQVQQGFDEANPVELEATKDAPPEVERGTPAE